MAQPWHGRFAWHELMTTYPKVVEGFYTKVVGWGTGGAFALHRAEG